MKEVPNKAGATGTECQGYIYRYIYKHIDSTLKLITHRVRPRHSGFSFTALSEKGEGRGKQHANHTATGRPAALGRDGSQIYGRIINYGTLHYYSYGALHCRRTLPGVWIDSDLNGRSSPSFPRVARDCSWPKKRPGLCLSELRVNYRDEPGYLGGFVCGGE